MPTPISASWSAITLSRRRSSPPEGVRPIAKARGELRVAIPRVLNLWSTHQFWIAFLGALGIETRRVEFSSDTSEDQAREHGKGRGTVDCCYPVKCMSGHYGELLARTKRKPDILLSPMIYSLPSFLGAHVKASLSCPRVMAAPENIKAGFLKNGDAFAQAGRPHAGPVGDLDAPDLPPPPPSRALQGAN